LVVSSSLLIRVHSRRFVVIFFSGICGNLCNLRIPTSADFVSIRGCCISQLSADQPSSSASKSGGNRLMLCRKSRQSAKPTCTFRNGATYNHSEPDVNSSRLQDVAGRITTGV